MSPVRSVVGLFQQQEAFVGCGEGFLRPNNHLKMFIVVSFLKIFYVLVKIIWFIRLFSFAIEMDMGHVT